MYCYSIRILLRSTPSMKIVSFPWIAIKGNSRYGVIVLCARRVSEGGGLVEKRKVCNSCELLGKPARSRAKPSEDPWRGASKAEVARLQKATKDAIPAEKREPLMPLFHDLAFLKVKLDEARSQLLHESIFTEVRQRRRADGLREHPGFAAYNKAVHELFPRDGQAHSDSAFRLSRSRFTHGLPQ